MSRFLGPDFLLDTKTARRLFHEVAAPLPIVDFHNHLPPAEIAGNHQWANLGEAWLAHDHYKWRLMRWAGVPESHVTGAASFREKYDAYAAIMPRLVGNPVHHWSHLELWRYFGLEGTVLSSDTAARCWDAAGERLAQPEFGARGLLERMKVELVGTTDDPLDTLEHHAAFAGTGSSIRMVPTFRPDRAIAIEQAGFAGYIDALAETAGVSIDGFDDLVGALHKRLEHFVAHGCRASDHGINTLDMPDERGTPDLDRILRDARQGRRPSADEAAAFRFALMVELGAAYARHDLVMQLHIGPLRSTRTRLFEAVGPDSGGDSMRDRPVAEALNALLDRMDRDDALPRTILYTLDPTKNAVMVTTAGNFQDGSVPGKVQAGTAWWFNDQLDGMRDQMTQLAQMGLISTFTGMLTDSRSFLSFPRHEYFRRLLCGMVGRWVEEGHVPDDADQLDTLVSDICYGNARKWFLDAA
ncbi:MAG: glucuronate isomerase [Rhizobiaceae bacterium]